MYVKSFHVTNFRRLKNVTVDLDVETSIFVGANNSGKTSATHIFQLFLGDSRGNFSIYDFSSDCWDTFNSLNPTSPESCAQLPIITLDLWLEVDEPNIHRVVDLLPSLDWDGSPVGVRLAFQPKDPNTLLQGYLDAKTKAASRPTPETTSYKPWPQTLTEYLRKTLTHEYEIYYSVLNSRPAYGLKVSEAADADETFPLGNVTSGAAKVVESLIRVDFLDAQRNLSDGESRGRHEDLSKRLSRFYARNLAKREDDMEALSAIADSETRLNSYFATAFKPVLDSLSELGYPGVGNHDLVVKAEFNPASILSENAHVHYAISGNGQPAADPSTTLPDRYNGLGFKNLIYMAIEMLDFHFAWAGIEADRPPIHLVMIEEPESHLHAQLQQVFIRKIVGLLPKPVDGFQTQIAVTTHSSHIIYESSFQNIRYFRRDNADLQRASSEVRNLSTFYDAEESDVRNFLLQYLKLTHCDLFFADAAVLVEGNVERLLVPFMIEKNYPGLQASHLTILEVGGAFAHKFDNLISFLDLPTLIITDLDSVQPRPESRSEVNQEDLLPESNNADADEHNGGKKCMADSPGAVTSSETLKQWIPGLSLVSDLLQADDARKFATGPKGGQRRARVAYQSIQPVGWHGTIDLAAGRTLEEAFALENLAWCQAEEQKELGLNIRGAQELNVTQMRKKLYERVKNFDKTKFALGLVTRDPNEWQTPEYIRSGLDWLEQTIAPQKTVLEPVLEAVVR